MDAVAIHSYTCTAHFLERHVSLYYDEFHLPIWITEFACVDDPSRQDAAGQAAYMLEAIPFLEKDVRVVFAGPCVTK